MVLGRRRLVRAESVVAESLWGRDTELGHPKLGISSRAELSGVLAAATG